MARKLTLAEMRRKSTDYFWSKDTKKAFKGAKERSYYADGKNYIRVSHPSGRDAWYKFSETGKSNYVNQDKVPSKIKKRAYPHK